MSGTQLPDGKNTLALEIPVSYQVDNTYTTACVATVNTSAQAIDDAPRRIISEASFKSRARNNKVY